MIAVHADGIAWPMETFIASHRFVEIDGTPPDFADHHGRLDVLLHDGTLQLDRFAPDLDWWNVRAIGVPHGSREFALCPACGGGIVIVFRTLRTTIVDGIKRSMEILTYGDCDAPYCDSYGDWWEDGEPEVDEGDL